MSRLLDEKLNPSEAIMGFCAWLTSRYVVVPMSAKHDSGKVVDLVTDFIKINDLPDIRNNYTDYLEFPKEKGE